MYGCMVGQPKPALIHGRVDLLHSRQVWGLNACGGDLQLGVPVATQVEGLGPPGSFSGVT